MNNADVFKKSIETLLRETDNIDFQIRRLTYDNQNLTTENNVKIGRYEKELESVEFQIKEALTKSKEEAIKVKCGWAHFRFMPDIFIFADGAIDEVETEYPDSADSFIKVSKSLKKDPLKKALISGEISLKNYTKEPQEKKFEYKYTGE